MVPSLMGLAFEWEGKHTISSSTMQNGINTKLEDKQHAEDVKWVSASFWCCLRGLQELSEEQREDLYQQ